MEAASLTPWFIVWHLCESGHLPGILYVVVHLACISHHYDLQVFVNCLLIAVQTEKPKTQVGWYAEYLLSS